MALAEIHFRTASPEDAEALAAIEATSFPDPSWTARDFLNYDCTVAEVGAEIVGFLVSRAIAPAEREILNLAVAMDYRRLGIASGLIEHERRRGGIVYLEVRESNVAAIHLYKSAGFVEISQRRAYYDNPPESAIVMCRK